MESSSQEVNFASSTNKENKTTGDTTTEGATTEEEKNNLYKSKLDTIISNFEEEKKQKNEEIADLNNKLLNIVSTIEKLKEQQQENSESKGELQARLNQLSLLNQELLKEIEDQMNAYEQMKKLQTNEIVEDDVVQEVQNLQKK